MTDEYLIWSNEHRAWWRPNRCGYTVHLLNAGHYSRAEAVHISSRAHDGWHPGEPPPEIPVRLDDAIECATDRHSPLKTAPEHQR